MCICLYWRAYTYASVCPCVYVRLHYHDSIDMYVNMCVAVCVLFRKMIVCMHSYVNAYMRMRSCLCTHACPARGLCKDKLINTRTSLQLNFRSHLRKQQRTSYFQPSFLHLHPPPPLTLPPPPHPSSTLRPLSSVHLALLSVAQRFDAKLSARVFSFTFRLGLNDRCHRSVRVSFDREGWAGG